jgi:hypothetical protein
MFMSGHFGFCQETIKDPYDVIHVSLPIFLYSVLIPKLFHVPVILDIMIFCQNLSDEFGLANARWFQVPV